MKKNISKVFIEILSPVQRETLAALKHFAKHGVLAGGTALALQLKHRRSYDLDIFWPKSVSKKLLSEVKKQFTKIKLIVDTSDELSFTIESRVKISLVFYPFPRLYPLVSSRLFPLLFWKDIGLDKAHTVGRRGEWQDYVDLYFILKHGFSLKQIIAGAKKKFGDAFSEKLFLSQLVYFEDISDFTVELLTNEKITISKLRRFFTAEIRKLKL